MFDIAAGTHPDFVKSELVYRRDRIRDEIVGRRKRRAIRERSAAQTTDLDTSAH